MTIKLFQKIVFLFGILFFVNAWASSIKRHQDLSVTDQERQTIDRDWQASINEDYKNANNPLNNEQETIYIKYHYIDTKHSDDDNGREIELYRNGYKYYRCSFLAPINGRLINFVEMATEPNYWQIFTDIGAGIHMRDTDKDKTVHMVYLSPASKIFLEFGQEVYYFQKHHAINVTNPNQTGYAVNAYQINDENYVMTLYTDKNSNLPTRIVFNPKNPINNTGDFSVEFDEYSLDKSFNPNMYKPLNVKTIEGDEKYKKQMEDDLYKNH